MNRTSLDPRALIAAGPMFAVALVLCSPALAQGTIAPCELQKLLASDGAADDRLGDAVAIDGDMAVIGAAYHDLEGGIDAGGAYVFVRNGLAWTQQGGLPGRRG